MDPDLRRLVASLPCLVCLRRPCGNAHHVTTRGAGGDDVPTNLMPLCPTHHTGDRGWHRDPGAFIRRHGAVSGWLKLAGRWDVLRRYGIERPGGVMEGTAGPAGEIPG